MGAAFAKNRPKAKNSRKVIQRLLSYMSLPNRIRMAVVFLCILVSALAGVAGSMFLEVLIDDYISPLLLSDSPVFTGLLRAIGTMALIYLAPFCTTGSWSLWPKEF